MNSVGLGCEMYGGSTVGSWLLWLRSLARGGWLMWGLVMVCLTDLLGGWGVSEGEVVRGWVDVSGGLVSLSDEEE